MKSLNELRGISDKIKVAIDDVPVELLGKFYDKCPVEIKSQKLGSGGGGSTTYRTAISSSLIEAIRDYLDKD